MAALTEGRNTPRKYLAYTQKYKVAASTTIHEGGIVAVNSAGFLVMASDAASLTVVGVAEESVDNSSGSNGDKSAKVGKGVYAFNNAATNAVAQTNVADDGHVADDNTIATTSTNTVTVGKILELDDDGNVWIEVGL